jgi:hypothetical protein
MTDPVHFVGSVRLACAAFRPPPSQGQAWEHAAPGTPGSGLCTSAIEASRADIVPDKRTGRIRRGKQRATCRYQRLCDVPLRGDPRAINLNWLAIGMLNAGGTASSGNSFATRDLGSRARKAMRREPVTRQGFFQALRTPPATMAVKRPPPLGP